MIRINNRAFVANWSEITRWDPVSFHDMVWHWPTDVLRPIGSVLKVRKEKVDRAIHDFSQLTPITIHFGGTISKRNVEGKNYSMELFFARPGDVVLSKIDLKNGAVTLVPDNWENVVITGHFATYEPDLTQLLPAYFTRIIQAKPFKELLWRNKTGGEGRKEVKLDFFLSTPVPLPPLPVQAAIVAAYETGVAEAARLRQEAVAVEAQIKELFAGSYGLNTQGAAPVPKCFTLKWSEIERWSLNYLGRTHFTTIIEAGAYPTVPLGELTQGRSGGTPSKRNLAFWKGPIPWVSPKDMKVYELHDAEDHISEIALEESAASLLPVNSILLVVRSGILQRLVPVGINRVPVTINQDIRAFTVTDDRLLPDFLGAYLRAAQTELLRLVKTGVTVESINRDELESLPIPLPPLEIQEQLLAQDALLRTQAAALRTAAVETQAATVARVEGMILGKETDIF